MQWSKLKNIILLILLATNLFLLCLLGYRNWNSEQYEASARANALEIMAKNGIHIEEAALPADLLLPYASVSREQSREAELLSPLLGSPVTQEALGGSQYLYSGEKGQASFRGRGEFDLLLSPNAFPAPENIADHAAATLGLMGFDAMISNITGTAQNGSVTLIQMWQGIPVLSCTAQAVYTDGYLTSVTGTRLSGTPTPTDSVKLSAVTGLLRFWELFAQTGDVCNRITVMRGGYQLVTGPSDPSTLVPVWYFATDTGAYLLDLSTNQLRKL